MADAGERIASLETTVAWHGTRLGAIEEKQDEHETFIAGLRATSRLWSSIGAFVGAIVGGLILYALQKVVG